jgi:hypothetical protein
MYHCTIDLLFDWFGLVCFANKNKNCQLSYSLLQTSQTGGQWYSDTSPFSIPWINSYFRQVKVVPHIANNGAWGLYHKTYYSRNLRFP